MSVLQFLCFLSLLAGPCLALQLGLDSEQKGFIVKLIKDLSEKAKKWEEIPRDTLRDFALDIIPGETVYSVEQYKNMKKPTLVFHQNGRVAVIDSVKGEEVTLLSPDGEVDEDVLAKMFNTDFVERFEELHKKKEFIVKLIKTMRKEAMEDGQDIVRTVLDKKFTFYQNGSVLVETDKGEVVGRFASEETIDKQIIETIFTVDAIAKVQMETAAIAMGQKETAAVGHGHGGYGGSNIVKPRDVPKSAGSIGVTQSVLVCVLALAVVRSV